MQCPGLVTSIPHIWFAPMPVVLNVWAVAEAKEMQNLAMPDSMP
jgi:hypothetical protein